MKCTYCNYEIDEENEDYVVSKDKISDVQIFYHYNCRIMLDDSRL